MQKEQKDLSVFNCNDMKEKTKEDSVPAQQTGVQTNTETSTLFDTVETAKAFYEKVKARLLQVNRWHHFAGALTADFQLTDKIGNDVDRPVEQGDHFKIDIPGPGPVTGDGYDWVKVEAIDDKKEGEEQSLTIRVRPATNPTNGDKDVAHFFSPEATSCFVAKLHGTTVTAAVYGRNEKPNTHTETLTDKTRNAAVAGGAITGLAKLQWKSLVNGLVKKDD